MTEIHSYQLSTAENELGVVIAHSEAGGYRVSDCVCVCVTRRYGYIKVKLNIFYIRVI